MKRYIKANSRKRRVVANDLVNTLVELTKGMWFYPMDKFSQIVYNADEIIPVIDYAACVEFGTNNGQEILIYDMQGGRKHIKYSCSMTEIFNEIVITDVWDNNGQVYACDYDAIWDELAAKNNWNGEFDYGVEATTKRKCNRSIKAFRDDTVDKEAVRELVLVITNDGDQYRQQITPVINNLKRKAKKGNYDPELAVKLWQYVADEGVRRYDKEYGSGKGSVSMLNPATRRAIAEELRDEYEEEVMWDINHADVNSSIKASADSGNAKHYRLIDYFDVWGNEEDGWDVNDVTVVEDDIVITDDATDEEILDYLIDTIGWLSPNARNEVRVESWDENFIEFFEDATDMPLGRLEATK